MTWAAAASAAGMLVVATETSIMACCDDDFHHVAHISWLETTLEIPFDGGFFGRDYN